MNFEQILQMMFSMVGNQVNSNLNPGSPLGTQITQQVLGSLMGEGPAAMISQSLGPEVNKMMFGTGPFAGFGGMGSQYNYASRMTAYNQELFTKSFQSNVNSQMTLQNETQYLNMMQNKLGGGYGNGSAARAGMKSDWQYYAIAGMNAMVGADQVAYGVRDTATSMGYTFGAGFDTRPAPDNFQTENRRIGDNIRNLSTKMMTSYMEEGNKFGNLTGRDVGDLTREMGSRGELREMAGGNMDVEGIKNKIQSTSKALSGIRDIIKGSIPEVLRTLEATFGGDSMNTLGIQKISQGMQRLRQLSETTGTSLTDMMQYSRASGSISQQVAGYSQGAQGAGTTISALLAANNGGDMRGIDSAAYARTATERVTGAQLSETGLMVSGALSMLDDKRKAKFKEALSNNNQPLTADLIASLSGLSTGDVLGASRSRAARDMMSEDSTGTYAAMKSSQQYYGNYRKDILQRGLGLTSEQAAAASSMSQRELEAKYGKPAVGNITPQLDMLAKSAGFNNAEEQTKFYRDQERAQRLEVLSANKAEWATALQGTGGSISAMIRNVGGKGMLEGKFSESISSLFNTLEGKNLITKGTKESVLKAFNEEGIRAYLGDKNADFAGGRNRVVDAEMKRILSMDPTSEEFTKTIRDMETMTPAEFWAKREEEHKKSVEGAVDFNKGSKGGAYNLMSYADKTKAVSDVIKTRAADLLEKNTKTSKRTKKVDGVVQKDRYGNEETEEYQEALSDEERKNMAILAKDPTNEAARKASAGVLSNGVQSDEALIANGVTRTVPEILEDIFKTIMKWIDKDKV